MWLLVSLLFSIFGDGGSQEPLEVLPEPDFRGPGPRPTILLPKGPGI